MAMSFQIRYHVFTSTDATEEVPGSNFGRDTNHAEDLGFGRA
jgi:hypothetical protein